jgi:hypothetical protein
MDLTYIIYSHSSYSDILKIQTDYIKNIKEKRILFIDKELDKLNNFDEIITYDNKLTYSERIYTCLQKIKITTKYILFTHENNIIIKKENDKISNLLTILTNNNIDRLDLCCYKYINFDDNINFDDYILVKSLGNSLSGTQIYNVGLAIYKNGILEKIMRNKKYNYREIEGSWDIEEYCRKEIKCYYINYKENNFKLNCGYFHLSNIFLYLHITHNNNLLSKKNNLYPFMKNEYIKILKHYQIKRKFNPPMS